MHSSHKVNYLSKFLLLPFRLVLKFGKAEAGEGFSFAGEKLLHQPIFMDLERFEFLAVGGNQLIEVGQAVGDLLLFGYLRKNNPEFQKVVFVQNSVSSCTAR